MPTQTSVVALRSGETLPCMRVLLPIICSGGERRADGSNSPTVPKPRRTAIPPAPSLGGGHPPRMDPHSIRFGLNLHARRIDDKAAGTFRRGLEGKRLFYLDSL